MNRLPTIDTARALRALRSAVTALALVALLTAGGAVAAAGDIQLVSTSDAGVKGNHHSSDPSLSDGSKIAFESNASNLDPADTDFASSDIYVKDLASGDIQLVSTSDAGVKGNENSCES